jgi:NAD(P)-dependent dehydrogenase (short-subunit alcohol dehydrogenase family)
LQSPLLGIMTPSLGGTMKEVEDKVAVITGAASGIGRGMAESFVAAGMKVVLSDIEEGPLAAAIAALRREGADVHGVVTDVSKSEQVEALAAETLRKYGAVHVLCNNAGVGAGGWPGWTTTLDDWHWVLGVNLMGVIHGVHTFMPIMVEQGTEAHVVNTASVAGLISGDALPYSVSKSAVVALSEGILLDLQRGGFKPKISVLCPGFVNTSIFDSNRNRPSELANKSAARIGARADAIREWFQEQIRQGLSPRAVGDQVLSAIREEQFYILTHPGWRPHIERRMHNIVSGTNPTMPPLPESLAKKLNALGAGPR